MTRAEARQPRSDEATQGMPIRALAPWFGGKRRLAPEIIRELGSHRAYDEPFCGSAAVLFAKPRSEVETINDLHGDLVNLAMCVASYRCEELYRLAFHLLNCESTLRSFFDELRSDTTDVPAHPDQVEPRHLQRAVRYLALSWMGRNGVSGSERVNYQIAVRWTLGGGSPSRRWSSVIESMPAWHERLRGVVILQRDAFEILPKVADEQGRVMYVDPPYFTETRGTGGGSRYLYDFGAARHAELAAALQRFRRTRIVVSYYDDPRLTELYPGWTKRVFAWRKNLALQNARDRRGVAEASEVLLINGPSLMEAEQMPLFAGADESEVA